VTNTPLPDPEGFTPELNAWLSERMREQKIAVDDGVEVEFLPGPASGNSNVTLPFDARWCSEGRASTRELVLRMQVPTNRIFLDTDVLRERRVLSALNAVKSFPTPATPWAEPDPTVLGQPFFVMERVPGAVPAGTPSIHATGWLHTCTAEQCRAAWDSALAAVAAIHEVDWRRTVPFLAHGVNGTSLAQRLDHVAHWYEWACAGREFPITDTALAYLRDHVPDLGDVPPVLVWGDARMGNLVFGVDHEVAAVLDWELASIGPAEIDLGWWLAMDEFQTVGHGVAPVAGYPDREETIAHYERLTGRLIREVGWFEVLCAFMLTVTVIRMADIGVAAGRLPADTRMGQGNVTAQMLARHLDLPVPELDIAYATRRGLDRRR
jgi:aminoglycoside phosphotransferase (APT) family kinase protein